MAVFEQRIKHTDDVLPLLGGSVDLGDRLAGLDVVGSGLENLFQVIGSLVVLAGVAASPCKMQPVAGLRLIGGTVLQPRAVLVVPSPLLALLWPAAEAAMGKKESQEKGRGKEEERKLGEAKSHLVPYLSFLLRIEEEV